MLRFVCILGLFSAIFAAAVPKPCCSKRQMTADLHQITGSYTNGTPSTVETLMKIQYDYDTLMIKLELADGTTIIQDFNQTKQYTTSGKSCRTDDIQGGIQLQPPCVPSNAIYRGRNTIGDDVTYDVDTWFVAGTAWGNITVSVMAHDCTPVMQGTSSNSNNVVSQTTIFYHNVQFTTLAATTFQVPQPCPQI
ncbi:uncharacterized protein LOC127708408 isoform X1 [Mytilus californianus]|uniref:uncharacterized protein LOC127708408 isoform X1 n=1 Tax=Mytilus californianus TaxID=6549 RepID=UPI002245F43B|nr:uncharacterized protein LOC127708408 isoform X1 [Mytilus californianus]